MNRRASSSSTVRTVETLDRNDVSDTHRITTLVPVQATIWVHEESFSPDEIVINPSILSTSSIAEGDLVEVVTVAENIEVHDFGNLGDDSTEAGTESVSDLDLEHASNSQMKCLCVAKFASTELLQKNPGLEVSLSKSLANAFGFRPRTVVSLTRTEYQKWTASHVELSFRDAYIARCDMWRMVSKDVAGRTLYKGQKLSFFGSLKVTVKSIHVQGRHVSTGYFAKTTIPVFRSEAARFVLFIQMSREMWDFDSEGSGEIMFNKVINGFLPDLFRRWIDIEVRHLVSIIMFGRLEYDRYDFGDAPSTVGTLSQASSNANMPNGYYQDFYKVVVTDMASAQWTTILNQLKKDFRVFLRDINLHAPDLPNGAASQKSLPPKITGRPSSAMKGNILEAINLASSQFANDYIDRDLIRTGISTVIITAGTGVFDVDRDLLKLTSENLTNNGIGIDIVCLSRMPLHSVPLFRYRLPQTGSISRVSPSMSGSPHAPTSGVANPSLTNMDHSPAYSSFTSTSANYFSRFPSAFPSKLPQKYGYGIPQWIDLSYWSSDPDGNASQARKRMRRGTKRKHTSSARHPFLPRVRMYELQMMGIMELGMADISIPYLTESNGKQQRRRRRVHSDLSQLTSARSLSRSPTFFRKGKPTALRQKESQGLLGSQAKSLGGTFDDMDKYDESVFRSLDKSAPRSSLSKSRKKLKESSTLGTSKQLTAAGYDVKKVQGKNPVMAKTAKRPQDVGVTPTKPQKPREAPRISRSISYALRGLAPPMRTAASPEVNVENVKAQPLLAKTSLAQAMASSPTHAGRAESVRSSDTERDPYQYTDYDTRSILSSDTQVERPSKPISIGGVGPKAGDSKRAAKSHALARMTRYEDGRDDDLKAVSLTNSPSSSDDDPISEIQSLDLMPESVPRSTLPFVRNVNASNPLKRHPRAASAFERWQHLYPQQPRSSTVKWRSLCTPASVPLTTEDFPSAKELASEYDTREHSVSLKYLNDLYEESVGIDVLLQEMIALRLAHGYQVITGEGVARAIGKGVCDHESFLDAWKLNERGRLIYMIMGNTIQRLSFPGSEQIDVTKYVRRIPQMDYAFPQTYYYAPNIRTILSAEYKQRPIQLKGFSEEYPWESADDYLAAGGHGQDEKVHELRFWRARFVLLPVEPPANAYRPQHQSDDNEEEIHLLGIRALTQMWQRARFFPEGERKTTQGRMGTHRRKDQNPLEVKFETLNPSEVVTTELDKLLALEGLGEMQSTQLLPDSEKLDRETPMGKLAQAIQGDKGIEFRNRRWHLRLHYNCFQGEEFTNWLLHNVKNIETRDEAVEFGNELMKEGLFEHVSGRHFFRDGNYFYSLKTEFRLPRLDLKGSWFAPGRRSDRSIPPTPLSEHPSREPATLATRSRSGSSLAFHLNPSTPSEVSKPLLDKKKKTVCLSKMIKIDVDDRRRKSSRREIVNLHYDRLHNPENCYHIELNWLNVTSKLVDDAIVSWTSQAERYGLKLVEIPIAEACEIPKSEPFRAVHRIKLAVEPPRRDLFNHVFTSSSFSPQPNPTPDMHIYQKALLRRFNFVLDLEAASEFPENVEIEYSWGKLSYRYTQFIHRSGIILAQITTEGDILLLANRLYNSRHTSSKEGTTKFDLRKEGAHSFFRPPMPIAPASNQSQIPTQSSVSQPLNPAIVPSMTASGIIGLNAQSPALSPFSPRTSADVLGSKLALSSSHLATYVTPEQIKEDIETFCSSATKLEQFYREVDVVAPPDRDSIRAASTSISMATNQRKSTTGSSSSSLLRPIKEPAVADTDLTDAEVLDFRLPESITSPASSSLFAGTGSGVMGAYGSLTGSVSGSVSGGNGTASGQTANNHSNPAGSGALTRSDSPASFSGGGTGSTSGAEKEKEKSSSGLGSLGFGIIKRARGSVMYDSVAEMFGSSSTTSPRDKAKDNDTRTSAADKGHIPPSLTGSFSPGDGGKRERERRERDLPSIARNQHELQQRRHDSIASAAPVSGVIDQEGKFKRKVSSSISSSSAAASPTLSAVGTSGTITDQKKEKERRELGPQKGRIARNAVGVSDVETGIANTSAGNIAAAAAAASPFQIVDNSREATDDDNLSPHTTRADVITASHTDSDGDNDDDDDGDDEVSASAPTSAK